MVVTTVVTNRRRVGHLSHAIVVSLERDVFGALHEQVTNGSLTMQTLQFACPLKIVMGLECGFYTEKVTY